MSAVAPQPPTQTPHAPPNKTDRQTPNTRTQNITNAAASTVDPLVAYFGHVSSLVKKQAGITPAEFYDGGKYVLIAGEGSQRLSVYDTSTGALWFVWLHVCVPMCAVEVVRGCHPTHSLNSKRQQNRPRRQPGAAWGRDQPDRRAGEPGHRPRLPPVAIGGGAQGGHRAVGPLLTFVGVGPRAFVVRVGVGEGKKRTRKANTQTPSPRASSFRFCFAFFLLHFLVGRAAGRWLLLPPQSLCCSVRLLFLSPVVRCVARAGGASASPRSKPSSTPTPHSSVSRFSLYTRCLGARRLSPLRGRPSSNTGPRKHLPLSVRMCTSFLAPPDPRLSSSSIGHHQPIYRYIMRPATLVGTTTQSYANTQVCHVSQYRICPVLSCDVLYLPLALLLLLSNYCLCKRRAARPFPPNHIYPCHLSIQCPAA